jgi:hypothetical protein
MGFPISTGGSGHGDVRDHLLNSGDPEVQRMGSQLADLHSKRIQTDYRLDRTDIENQKTAAALVQEAGRMIQILESRCTGPQREHIREAIQEWKRRISG